jgi:hypothetical protein
MRGDLRHRRDRTREDPGGRLRENPRDHTQVDLKGRIRENTRTQTREDHSVRLPEDLRAGYGTTSGRTGPEETSEKWLRDSQERSHGHHSPVLSEIAISSPALVPPQSSSTERERAVCAVEFSACCVIVTVSHDLQAHRCRLGCLRKSEGPIAWTQLGEVSGCV